MATHKLGKLKFKFSKDGIAFRVGDGEIRRLNFGKKKAAETGEDEYNADAYSEAGEYADDAYEYEADDMNPGEYADDEYADGEYDEGEYADEYADDDYSDGYSEGYSGRYSRRDYDEDYADEYADSDYEDDYAESGYADEDDYYDDDPYAEDDGYADEYAEDGYDDGYYEEGEYDDRYQDEDAADYGDGYVESSPLMRYVDEHDWVTFLLLFLLPPLGIYLLWRRMRFERPIRWAVSAASAIWFIILIILLISLVFTGGSDETKPSNNLIMTTPQPVIVEEPTVDPVAGIIPAATMDALAPDVTATPIPSANADGTGTGVATANTVYMPATGLYYHNTDTCSAIDKGVKVSKVTLDVAENKKMAPCPVCYEGQEFCFATVNGKYYHTVDNCSGMQGATRLTVNSAKNYGKTACPACVSGKVNTLSNSGLKFANSATVDQSGITVYATENGKYFHTKSNCSGMRNAVSGSLLKAMLIGKTACPECAASAGTTVYATKNGTWYHSKSNCSGMQGAYTITLAEALILGKGKCNVCMKANSASDMTAESITDGNTVYVYATKAGKYYHTKSNCSGMTGASKYTLKSMLLAGRAACPTCAASAKDVVYATAGGTYFHSYKNCSGIKNAVAGTLAQALAYGYKRCPECWVGNNPVDPATVTSNSNAAANSGSGIVGNASPTGTYVYAVKNGSRYHTKSTCSGMTNASKIALETAVQYKFKPCQTCAAYADNTVYSTKNGTYFHATSDCSDMKNATKRTMEEAILLGQMPCPTCVARYESGNSATVTTPTVNLVSSGTYTAGTSGIKVYATTEGKYFHTKSGCGGQTNASYITLETALNYGKVGCPTCSASANTAVYAVRGGKYYHYSLACAGTGAVSNTRADALAYGFDPCPYCVSKTQAVVSSNTYKAGTSGIKVFASISGKYYHTDSACAGASASHITLETALNYGKTACPSCAASASKTVYAKKGTSYYHSSASCAGAGSVGGTFAAALAYGLKECPYCIGGSESYEESDIKYSAPASTQVFINVDSDLLYYHSSSRCEDAGMASGTRCTLDFVLRWGYYACPFCTPPTSIG